MLAQARNGGAISHGVFPKQNTNSTTCRGALTPSHSAYQRIVPKKAWQWGKVRFDLSKTNVKHRPLRGIALRGKCPRQAWKGVSLSHKVGLAKVDGWGLSLESIAGAISPLCHRMTAGRRSQRVFCAHSAHSSHSTPPPESTRSAESNWGKSRRWGAGNVWEESREWLLPLAVPWHVCVSGCGNSVDSAIVRGHSQCWHGKTWPNHKDVCKPWH